MCANGNASDVTRRKDYRDVVVTHINEDGKLMLQQIGTSSTGALEELMRAFKSFHLNRANAEALPGAPKVGDIVAAQFSADNEWYRARVRRVDRDAKKADLLYIDYGNSESLPWSKLRPLTQSQFAVTRLKGQAVPAVLSFLQLPVAAQYLKETIDYVQLKPGETVLANWE